MNVIKYKRYENFNYYYYYYYLYNNIYYRITILILQGH
jgi:hypothetical protein